MLLFLPGLELERLLRSQCWRQLLEASGGTTTVRREKEFVLRGHCQRLKLHATDVGISIARGVTFISDMYNLVSDLHTQESGGRGLISVCFLIRIEM